MTADRKSALLERARCSASASLRVRGATEPASERGVTAAGPELGVWGVCLTSILTDGSGVELSCASAYGSTSNARSNGSVDLIARKATTVRIIFRLAGTYRVTSNFRGLGSRNPTQATRRSRGLLERI